MQERWDSSKEKTRIWKDQTTAKVCQLFFRSWFQRNILQFEGQTKDKLGSLLARPVVDSIVSDKLTFFLMENGELASNLIRKAIKAGMLVKRSKARDESRNGKKEQKTGAFIWGIDPSPV